MSHQHRLGNYRPEATGLTKADNCDDHMQKKSENIALSRWYQTKETLEFRALAEFAYDSCCDHRAMFADEDLHRHAVENLDQADVGFFF
jgi:hypothetical protein